MCKATGVMEGKSVMIKDASTKHFFDPLLLSFLWVSQRGRLSHHHREVYQNHGELIKQRSVQFCAKGTKEEQRQESGPLECLCFDSTLFPLFNGLIQQGLFLRP